MSLKLIIVTLAMSTSMWGGASFADEYYELVKNSDDFDEYGEQFTAAAEKLISNGKCNSEDFQEMGHGWFKATGPNAQKPVYFIYCGGFHRSNRLYLNTKTDQIFQ